MEMMNLKPQYARKLDESGLSPMHLALQNKRFRTVRGFMSVDSNLIRIKGRGGMTPLHYAAQTGGPNLLSEFLSACPSSVEDLTIKCETVVLVALKNRQFDAFRVLVGWLQRDNQVEMLNWKDEDGNTPLHVATSMDQIEAVKLLCKKVHVNAKNFEEKTALDIFQSKQSSLNPDIAKILRGAKAKEAKELTGPTRTLPEYLMQNLSIFERRNKLLGLSNFNSSRKRTRDKSDIQSSVLVVAILIATATYQAGLSPPGGYWQDDSSSSSDDATEQHVAGQMTMNFDPAIFFYGFNGVSFFSSMAVIIFFIIGLPTWTVLCGSIVALGISNLGSFAYTFPNSEDPREDVGSFILELAYPVCATWIAAVPLIAYLLHDIRRRRVDTFKGGISGRIWD
ncbi:PREDICTED: ankyrin repeat-containing protein At2g01680-like [Tarenaya hassleriana]|uniref:ankyrin repeat-containing protein At2g01680-like n=1 Tax=Tarenaya hassleriana TaxID=28532 RepID=UPI00053C2859|nr:PREDICTED: ankyrin repeat-containing protein At2g01680-like [Tarenaya hassleriana]